ncbi:MAG: DNA repair protein RadA, partial [Gammaproteobacteria bacterium]|nr:DNA repair protein RadA [Gammaproteobacteria bacterium]
MATRPPKSSYSCTECGATTAKWVGQCPDCGAWNSLTEVQALPATPKAARFSSYAPREPVQRLAAISAGESVRYSSGLGELDRALGGGLVEGSAVLIGGDPGIGKSTLLLQSLAVLSRDIDVLYVTGEESVQQIALRAQRLELEAPRMGLLADNCVERIIETAQKTRPRVLVADSIQTLFTEQLQSAPGSVAQVREAAGQLVRFAKQTATAVILVGHVTKEGSLAGPRVLEHMVDTVLYFEGEPASRFRLVRAIKNRFGAVNEIGVFAMTDRGLRGVDNPSAMFINREQEDVAGSVVLATQEGTRPLLVEVQALVDQSALANPRRLTVGLDHARLGMLLAVLHRHLGVTLHDHDVFVNVVGGVRVIEPAADLAIALSVLSSFRDRALNKDLAAFGEIGLA